MRTCLELGGSVVAASEPKWTADVRDGSSGHNLSGKFEPYNGLFLLFNMYSLNHKYVFIMFTPWLPRKCFLLVNTIELIGRFDLDTVRRETKFSFLFDCIAIRVKEDSILLYEG